MTSPSASPVASPSAEAGGVNTVEDAQRISQQLSEEIEKLSELDSATAVVAGNIALVGITYDDQYQGGLTERMQQMIDARVQTVDKTLTAVRVTDEESYVKQIEELAQRLQDKSVTFDELQTQALQIGSQLNGGGDTGVAQPQSTAGA